AGIIDDRSRFLTGARFVRRTDAVRFAGVLRAAVAAHGIPSVLYCDNGSAFIDSSLERACAVLGMKLTHSAPSRPPLTGQCDPGPLILPVAARLHFDRVFPGSPACRVDRLGSVRVTRVP